MNRKRFYRYRYHSHPFSSLLTTATATVVAAAIALAILSSTVFSKACPPPRKFSSTKTVVPQPTVDVTRHFRSTKIHTPITSSGCSRFPTNALYRQRPYITRPLASTRRKLCETVTVGLIDGKDRQANNTNANNTNTNNSRCYKIKYTTPVPTTKRWSPILKTYPQFPVANDTTTKPDTEIGATRTKAATTRITKTAKASTTTEETDLSDETQEDIAGETTSNEESICAEENTCPEETTYCAEETTYEEETEIEETTSKKKTSSKTEETKNTTNEPTITEKNNNTTEKSSKTTGKSNKTIKVTKTTKKMTRTTEEIDEVTCPDDPDCTDEPSCIDNDETKKPKKMRSLMGQKSTAMIKQKNRSKKRHLDRRKQRSTTVYNRWSSSSLSSGTIALDDSLWFHDGLNYKSLNSDLTQENKLQSPPIYQKGLNT
ncbi:unnamed protein product [Aphis gossypii]|uniref:Uncharacterized protein n=1 Tax=Aphis gossypii TaxID=80765 RepID=A0A9P0J728_APHGO|nr:unnamed protein product [Aphis gossypii]